MVAKSSKMEYGMGRKESDRMKNRYKELWKVFVTFFKIGAFTFGGGYAMIPLIQKEAVENHKWVTDEDILNVVAIAESTPGPIAINAATFVGYQVAGFAGAVAATLGIVLPSFCVIYVISSFLDGFLEYPLIAKAFQGIKVGVGVLILDAGINMIKKMPKKPQPRITAGCAFAAMLLIEIFALNITSVALMLVAAVVSLSIYLVKGGASK